MNGGYQAAHAGDELVQAGSLKYFCIVVLTFVVVGPLVPVAPFIWQTMIARGAWQLGAAPALFAAVYFFAFTATWLRTTPRGWRRYFRSGALGALSGILGMATYTQIVTVTNGFERVIFTSPIASSVLGAMAGLGASLLIAWICHPPRPAKQSA